MTKPRSPLVRFQPLGGLGEVGMNCAVLECQGRIVLIDCGVNFPDVDAWGIEVLVPNFDMLERRAKDILGVVITHGHQDHIGALPWLLSRVDVPIYAPGYAAGLIRSSLDERVEQGLIDPPTLHVVGAEEPLELGPFRFEFVPMTHSIPDTHGLLIHTPIGVLFHSGDFKLDTNPKWEAPAPIERLKALGDKGVRALLSDSTNIEVPGRSGSESDVAQRILEVVEASDKRVFLTMFSTNIFRVRAALEAAAATGRVVTLLGRSLQRNVAIARSLGHCPIPKGTSIVDSEVAIEMERSKVVVLCTGSQAQPRAALTRMAHDDFRHFKLTAGDLVVFSARTIPGNDRVVGGLKDALMLKGVEVMDAHSGVHCSGHAYRDEQKELIELLRPETFIPVHGDHRYLIQHARLAAECGVDDRKVLRNGDLLELGPDFSRVVVNQHEAPDVVVGIDVMGAINGEAMRMRRKIAKNGLIILRGQVKGQRFLGPPQIQQLGVLGEDELKLGYLEDLGNALEHALRLLSVRDKRSDERKLEALRVCTRRFFRRELERFPVIENLIELV